MRKKPPCLDDSTRRSLLEALQQRPWWQAASDEDAGQIYVIETALSGHISTRRRWINRVRSVWGGGRVPTTYVAEALAYVGDGDAVRRLQRYLRNPELFVRRQAARSLMQIGSEAAVDALLVHVGSDLVTGGVPFDIESADVIRYTIDAILMHQNTKGGDLLAELLSLSAMRAHDIPQRAALALCLLGDDRCMWLSPESGLPEAIHAAISPLGVRPGDPFYNYTAKVARWVRDSCDVPLAVPDGSLTHLQRIHLSREMVEWATSQKV